MTPPPGYILIRPETLVGIQKAIEAALGARAGECLAEGGRAGGAKATATLEGDAIGRAHRLLSAGREIGWGDFALERLTPTALVVSVGGSPFARAYGAAAAPVCHLTRGVLESLAAVVLERPAAMVETVCAAMGADRCRFESVAVDDGGDEASPPSPPRSTRGQSSVPPSPPRFTRGQSAVRA
jgi:predicted hydrocarbon binding protein